MKKIAIILAAALAAFSFASCEKAEIAAPEANEGVIINKVDINVSNPGADTKAVKSAWVAGDKLNLWFGVRTNLSTSGKPDFVIKYDGTSWVKDTEAAVSGNEPGMHGTFKVIYEANNNWNYGSNTYCYASRSYVLGAYVYEVPMMVFSNEVSYTVEDGVFKANISNWEYVTPVQVVVTGLDSSKDPSNYLLSCDYLKSVCGVYMSDEGIRTDYGYTDRMQIGVANEDGVAFYFYPDANTEKATAFTFNLLDQSSNTQTTGKLSGQIANDKTKCQSIKIDASKISTPEVTIIDGIVYKLSSVLQRAYVEKKNYFSGSEVYSGAIEIPASITVGSDTYNVTKIDRDAFSKCSELTSVSLPEGLEDINSGAFERTSLTSLHLPASLSNINESNSVFNGSTNLKITVAEGSTYFFVEDEMLYGTGGGTNNYKLYFVPETKTGDIVLNANTKSIVSNGTCYYLAADSFEFPAGFKWRPWGLFRGSIKDGFVVKFNNTTYESFTSVFGTSLQTYVFGLDDNIKKIVFSFPSEVSDEDFASIQTWFGENAKEVVRR